MVGSCISPCNFWVCSICGIFLTSIMKNFKDKIMIEETKEVVDIAAASTAILTLGAWLPPIASLFTIVWLGLRIYESDTVQKIIFGKTLTSNKK